MTSTRAGRRSLTVMEPFHSPFYAPLYVAVHLGHFAEEGLDVATTTASASGGTVRALLEGTIEIALGGVMRSLELADRGGPVLPHVIEVNSRNGFFLVARTAHPGFTWKELAGATVVSFAEAPTPWQCMLTVLRRHGVDPATVRIERERPVPEAVAAFLSGHGDFLEQAQPVVEQLLADGRVHLVASMGEATGPVPFSSFMTTRAFLEGDADVVTRFTRAFHRTQRWIAAHAPDEIAATIRAAYPDIAAALLTRIVDRYQRQGTWAREPVLGRQGYETLQQILLDGGFIARRHRYEDVIDVAIAERVVREHRAAAAPEAIPGRPS